MGTKNRYKIFLENLEKPGENYTFAEYEEDLTIGRPYHYLIEMGLIKSYPSINLINVIKKKYPDCKEFVFNIDDEFNMRLVSISKKKGNSYVADRIIFRGIDKSEMPNVEKICTTHGYNCIYNPNDDEYVISPKFDEKYKANDNLPMYLFHITPKSNEKKIKEIGLCPYNKKHKENSNIPDYDARIYFFTEFDEDLFASYANQSKHMSKVYDKKSKELNTDIQEYAVFVINRKKLPKNVEFHLDVDFPGGIACWTTSNIPPSAIIDTVYF